MRPRMLLILSCSLATAAWVLAQESLPEDLNLPAEESLDPEAALAKAPPTDARHYSYAIGMDIGSSFKSDELKLDAESLLAGVRDGLAGAKPKFSDELCGVALQRLARQRAKVLYNRSAAFLAENAKKEGVQVTPTGLQYKVVKSGPPGGASPKPTSKVQILYRGELIDGTVFDGTAEGKPATFDLRRPLIAGWTEALPKMKVGDKWQLFIPPELAYEAEGFGDAIPPNAALVFELELVGME